MLEARRKARTSLDTMRQVFEASHFEVAVNFPFQTHGNPTEHLWGQLLELGQDEMKVSLATPPLWQQGAIPESHSLPLSELADWHVTLDDGSIRGSFSTQAQIAKLRREGEPVPRHLADLEPRFVDS
ncbi:MAG: hypothetical protein SGI99_05430 [Pseudomonadota bacterium]|nr:hypothetical protein [Pseudomonadota bacterium]